MKDTSLFRKDDSGTVPVEQHESNGFFQILNESRHGWLGPAKLSCRCRQTSRGHDRAKRFKLPDVETFQFHNTNHRRDFYIPTSHNA
ncbi:hypothetical protein GCM10007872_00510 [Gluconobacter sphaericus NBRC 12467]|uniref:Uncharacterized protein n=1 Tax=Gluconobacter sphaericus NBRC 12467 TaxID=1307951 RepID=A0AA37SFH3_9PROT|nr:hypothetical protein GSP01_23850 [Gluconobacter sphaericus NBRC 12467]GLQ83143.1 hypothetical protein GCM10007872_00510 [Gluconobacter sphaericus NBRC 12467]